MEKRNPLQRQENYLTAIILWRFLLFVGIEFDKVAVFANLKRQPGIDQDLPLIISEYLPGGEVLFDCFVKLSFSHRIE